MRERSIDLSFAGSCRKERLKGPEHRDTLTSVNNLAVLLNVKAQTRKR
jgi:hypothetical protein